MLSADLIKLPRSARTSTMQPRGDSLFVLLLPVFAAGSSSVDCYSCSIHTYLGIELRYQHDPHQTHHTTPGLVFWADESMVREC